MSRTRVKICGLTTAAAVDACVDAGADAVGFVFVPGSARSIEPEAARGLVARLPAFVEPVALFCNHDLRSVREIAAAAGCRTVQLHGGEPPEFAAALATPTASSGASPLRVVKGLPFHAATADEQLAAWQAASVAALLWDSPPDADAGLTGGSGHSFDWSAFAAFTRRHASDSESDNGPDAGGPAHVLAGGLTPDNVGSAIEQTRPYAVDVSSGVEVPDRKGEKDPARIRAFCAAVRGVAPQPA